MYKWIDYSKLILRRKSLFLASSLIVLLACTSADISKPDNVEIAEENNNVSSVLNDKKNNQFIEQITPAANEKQQYDATQINKNDESDDALTVAQLKEYVDRCAPLENSSAPIVSSKIDCSELSLRVKRQYKDPDELAKALTTLGVIGRPDTAQSTTDLLEKGDPKNSIDAQAIASGVLEPTVPNGLGSSPPEETLLGTGLPPVIIIEQ